MRYALKSDYEDYANVATADLPDEINRKLDRAEDLIEQIVRGKDKPEQRELYSDASSGQKEVSVLGAAIFEEDQSVTIEDDDNSETATIDDISTDNEGSDTITLESDLTNSYATSARAYIRSNDPVDFVRQQRWALRDATCAQVEYWEEMGESYDVQGSVDNFAIGNLRVSYAAGGGETVAPRAYRTLMSFGLLYAGVNNRRSTSEVWKSGDPRLD